MQDMILSFIQTHGGLSLLLTIAAISKAVFHPLMTVIENAVTSSGNAEAITTLHAVEASPAFKTLVWAVDYLTSINISTVQALGALGTPPQIPPAGTGTSSVLPTPPPAASAS